MPTRARFNHSRLTKKHLIKARVIGHYDPFYTVHISLPPIDENAVHRLIDAIANSPLLVAKLSARELDPKIDQLCSSLGIKLFPQHWSDLDMDCSCPDWAVPCKHIAAVIYRMSEEIDANPFILFSIRGINLISELASHGTSIRRATKTELPKWMDLLGNSQKSTRRLALETAVSSFLDNEAPALADQQISYSPEKKFSDEQTRT